MALVSSHYYLGFTYRTVILTVLMPNLYESEILNVFVEKYKVNFLIFLGSVMHTIIWS